MSRTLKSRPRPARTTRAGRPASGRRTRPSPVDPVPPAEVLDTMRSLGDPVRWEMLRVIAATPDIGIGELSDAFPQSKSTLSYHLKVLRQADLVVIRKAGRHRYVSLRPEGLTRAVQAIQSGPLVAPHLELSA
jgi:DNA-binding transcriptional ArsR family regulator